LKRSPLRDIASMLRSFHYAAQTGLDQQLATGSGSIESLRPWARFWYDWVSATFLRSYFDVAGNASFLPANDVVKKVLLDALLLDKAIYELGYELNNRPDW